MNRNSPTQSRGLSSLLLLDNENTRISGAYVGAFRLGLASSVEAATRDGIVDPALRLSLKRFRSFAAGTCRSVRAVLVGSSARGQDLSSMWEGARRAGWSTVVSTRAASGAEKGVDATISLLMLEETVLRGLRPEETEITLISGDADFVPAIEALGRYGFSVDVLGWQHSTAHALRKAARRFIPLDPFFHLLTYRATEEQH